MLESLESRKVIPTFPKASFFAVVGVAYALDSMQKWCLTSPSPYVELDI